MQFSDYTLEAGNIRSHRRQETGDLVEEAVMLCAHMLSRLRSGEEWVTHGIPWMPAFWVRLDVPRYVREGLGERAGRPSSFFCVADAERVMAFQVNAVLRAGPREDADRLAVDTVMELSMQHGERSTRMQARIEPDALTILANRPALVTAIIPATLHMDVVAVAADFSTCFAAAMLLEAKS